MPRSVDDDDFDLDQLIRQSLLVHLTDEELEGYHEKSVGEFDQLRVEAHLQRCLICERRSVTAKVLLTRDRDDCEAQQARLAEFGDLPFAELQRDVPAVAAHLAECATCRQVYEASQPLPQEVTAVQEHPQSVLATDQASRPLWQSIAQTAQQTGREVAKALSAGIHLMVNRAGQLVEFGLGPPSLQRLALHKTMGDDPVRKEWTLEDAEAGCRIHLTIEGRASGDWALRCWVESELSSAVNPAQMRIEARRAENRALRQAGQLAHYQKEPLILSPDSWIIRLEAPTDGQKYIWEIPVDVQKAAE